MTHERDATCAGGSWCVGEAAPSDRVLKAREAVLEAARDIAPWIGTMEIRYGAAAPETHYSIDVSAAQSLLAAIRKLHEAEKE